MYLMHSPVLELTFLILFALQGECGLERTIEFAGLEMPSCITWSCSDKCRPINEDLFSFMPSQCWCDQMCPILGDCCWNYFEECQMLRNVSDVIKYIGSIQEEVLLRIVDTAFKLKKYGSCRQVRNKQLEWSSKFYSVSKCPEGYRDTLIRTRCENNTLAVPLDSPVANKWNLKEVYSNLFCAMCHNLDVTNVIFWNASVLCSFNNEQTNLDAIIKKYSAQLCITVVDPTTTFQLRGCNDLQVKRCAPKTIGVMSTNITLSLEEVTLVCNSYLNPIPQKENLMANRHCTLCSFNTTKFESIDCFPSTFANIYWWSNNSTEYLIDVSLKNTTLSLINSNSKVNIPDGFCDVKQRYNRLLQRCDSVSCPGPSAILLPSGLCGSVATTGLLHHMPEFMWVTIDLQTPYSNPNSYKILVDMIRNLFAKTVEEHANLLMKASVSYVSQELEIYSVREYTTASEFDMWRYSIELAVTTTLTLRDTLSLLDVFYNHAIDNQKTQIFSPYTINRMSAMNYKDKEFNCTNGTTIALKNISLFTENGRILTYDVHSAIYLDLEFVPSTFVWLNTSSGMDIEGIIVCRDIFPHCETFEIQSDNFKEINDGKLRIFSNDGKLRIFSNDSELVMDIGTFSIANNKAYVCAMDFLNQCNLTDMNLHIDKTTTNLYHVASCSVSVVCLFLLLCILVAFKEKNTRYQKLVLVLTCMLILAYSLELCILVETSSTRAIIAATLHFVWLESFFVLGLIAFGLIQEVRKEIALIDNVRFFLAGVFVTVALSTAIVLSGIVLDLDYIGRFHVGYGHGDTIWWIKSPLPLVTFFVIPIAVTITFNLAVIVFLMYKLHTRNSEMKRWHVNAKRQYPLFIQTTLVLSLTWGIRATGEITTDYNISVVSYTLNTFVGVFFLWSYGIHCLLTYTTRTSSRNRNLQYITAVSNNTNTQTRPSTDSNPE